MTLNRQLVLNDAFAALKLQGSTSLLPVDPDPDPDQEQQNGRCAYRGEGGKKCAIGHLIPDDRYSPKIENKSPKDSAVREALDPKYGTANWLDEDFLCELQSAHDWLEGCHADDFLPGLTENLKAVANRYGLTLVY